jgi:predicted RNA-binding protein with RPS1 domain
MMGKTDADGVAVFQMEEGSVYTVHILKVPEGYVKNTEEYLTDDTYCDVYIPLEKAA